MRCSWGVSEASVAGGSARVQPRSTLPIKASSSPQPSAPPSPTHATTKPSTGGSLSAASAPSRWTSLRMALAGQARSARDLLTAGKLSAV
eukprot:1233083-Rhodomonas_salina.2